MKNILISFAFFSALAACNRPNTTIKEHISNADSVAINYFKGDGTMDTVTTVKIVKDKKIQEQLADLISASSATFNTKCGYDGSLHFFKSNKVVQDIDFRMNDATCMFFSFKQNGKITATILSPEAKKLLENIRK